MIPLKKANSQQPKAKVLKNSPKPTANRQPEVRLWN
jgi:hypothetical protein